MNSRKVAEDFVERLKAIVAEDEIRLRSVAFDPELYDIEIQHDTWGMFLSLDKPGESVRVLLDDYVIEGLLPSETLELITALVAGRAHVRVSKSPIFGKSVDLDVELPSSRRISERRRWGSGLANWEPRLLRS